MALTIQLPPDLEQRAREQAGASGQSVPDYVLTLLRGALTNGPGDANGPEGSRPRRSPRRKRNPEWEAEEERALAALLPGVPEPPPPIPFEEIRGATGDGRLVREPNGDRFYEYHPVTEHIVSAPRRCSGRLTVKGTRINPGILVGFLKRRESAEQIARDYRIPTEAVYEAAQLAAQNPEDLFERVVIPPSDSD